MMIIRSASVCFGVVAISLCSLVSGRAADDVDSLKREIELLKKENALLKKEIEQLKSQLSGKTPKRPDDEIVGIVWEISFIGEAGKVLGTGKFLAAEGSLYSDKKKIGTYTESGTKVRIDVTSAPEERANGVYNLIQFEKTPPTFRGNMKNTKGAEAKVVLRIIRD